MGQTGADRAGSKRPQAFAVFCRDRPFPIMRHREMKE